MQPVKDFYLKSSLTYKHPLQKDTKSDHTEITDRNSKNILSEWMKTLSLRWLSFIHTAQFLQLLVFSITQTKTGNRGLDFAFLERSMHEVSSLTYW